MAAKKKSVTYDPIIVYDEELKRWNVPSQKHEGHNYAVRIDPCSDSFTCTCVWGRGMQRKTGKECVHIKKVREWLLKQERSTSKSLQ